MPADIAEYRVEPDDIYLLCSDGLTDMVDPDVVHGVVDEQRSDCSKWPRPTDRARQPERRPRQHFGDPCLGATHIPKRVDENGKTYNADTDDAAYATFKLENDVVAHMNSSWCVRVRRDDLVTFQVDGTHGSAVAGLTKCWTQHRVNTPRPVWNPDVPQTMNFQSQWEEVPENIVYENGFKLQWEDFIRHVVADAPWHHGLIEGVKGVQLAELGLQSWKERRWLDVPDINI